MGAVGDEASGTSRGLTQKSAKPEYDLADFAVTGAPK
jgi:hypothetical protein